MQTTLQVVRYSSSVAYVIHYTSYREVVQTKTTWLAINIVFYLYYIILTHGAISDLMQFYSTFR